jgi:DNA-binding NarL/FixJ family response regulator
VRVLLADDQPEVLLALRLVLQQEPGFDVIGEVTTVVDLLDGVRDGRPDLVVLDWDLPRVQNQGFLTVLRSDHRNLTVLALSSRPEERPAALAAGADGFICKGESPDHLVALLRSILVSALEQGQPSQPTDL